MKGRRFSALRRLLWLAAAVVWFALPDVEEPAPLEAWDDAWDW